MTSPPPGSPRRRKQAGREAGFTQPSGGSVVSGGVTPAEQPVNEREQPGSKQSGDPICAGCNRHLEVGDQYIEGTAGDYLKQDVDPEIGGLLADIMGGNNKLDGSAGGRIIYCEDCTKQGGDFKLQTYYGDGEQPFDWVANSSPNRLNAAPPRRRSRVDE